MQILLFITALVASGFACSTGYGQDAVYLQRPVFTFKFYPPAEWTYYMGQPPAGVAAATATVYPGQASSQSQAEANMKTDVDNAIRAALSRYGASTSGTEWSVSGYVPIQCLVRADNGQAGWRAINTCAVQIGAVTSLRTVADSDTGADLVQSGTLRVSTNQLVTRGQWKALATEVFNTLSINSKVYFTSAIVLQ